MISMLIAYDAAGNVVATLDHMVSTDDDGNVSGLIDFAAHEVSGAPLTEVWTVDGAAGSGTWPEWINPSGFTVETEGRRIVALVHPSGHRRERAAIEATRRRSRLSSAVG